ncbi:MAG: hypothetical protein HKN79_06130 [Flavobacteriales bacterium]|nr:hypothetical protein [Flavobacteriales bacterium]
MKIRHILLICAAVLFTGHLTAGVIVVEGKYQLRNLFVLNGQSSAGVGFCVFEVLVNGDISTDEVNSDAFEIDLSQYGFELGDEIEVRIKHKDGCEPRVLNPEALEPMPTFEVKDITVSDDGLLEWSTINEQGALPFVVQQFKWNKWVNLGEVQGEGTSNENVYQFKLVPISGENRIRVIQKSFSGKVRASEPVSFESPKDEVTYRYDKKRDQITFSDETAFEIYNRYGQIAKRGFGKSVSVSNLRKSTYYLTYDSSIDEFIKK